ncbi:hypothetical protein Nmel_012708 [Mimus melanotis]
MLCDKLEGQKIMFRGDAFVMYSKT